MNQYDIDTLIAIKSSFQANNFQWIKTNDRSKLGQVVTVRDVVPGRNGRFIAMLSDGTQLDTDRVSSDLMMLTDDQPALSMAEVQSINYVPSLSEGVEVSADIPQDFRQDIQKSLQEVAPETGAPVRQIDPNPESSPLKGKPVVEVDPSDLFGMFSLEDTELNLAVKVKLPSKALLKMMYTNSKNKEEFLTKLSNYINNNVTVDAIKKTMKKALSGEPKKKSTATNE